METLYFICAVGGATLLVCQFVFSLLGFGEHHDLDADHDVHVEADHDHGGDQDHDHEHQHSWFVGVLSLRAIVSAITFFGIAGMTGTARKMDEPATLGAAALAGLAAITVVAYTMRFLHKLKAEGTVRIDRAVGKNGTVYLTVPEKKSGVGKVTLSLQNRTMEYQAVTAESALATGSKIVVVGVVGPDTVEVAQASESERSNHV